MEELLYREVCDSGEQIAWAYRTGVYNRLVFVDDVVNGNRCDCVCPKCRKPLCARNGGIKNVHHFAHQRGVDSCMGASETVLHQMAKEIIEEEKQIMLPDYKDGTEYGVVQFDAVDVEKIDDRTGLKPDCIGYLKDKTIFDDSDNLWIEMRVAHKVTNNKRTKIIKKKIRCVEIDLADFKLGFKREDRVILRSFLLNEKKNRVWIFGDDTLPKVCEIPDESYPENIGVASSVPDYIDLGISTGPDYSWLDVASISHTIEEDIKQQPPQQSVMNSFPTSHDRYSYYPQEPVERPSVELENERLRKIGLGGVLPTQNENLFSGDECNFEEVKPNYHPKFWINKDGTYELKDIKDIKVLENITKPIQESLYECIISKGQDRYSFDQLREYVLLKICEGNSGKNCCELCEKFRRGDASRFGARDECTFRFCCDRKLRTCSYFSLDKKKAELITSRVVTMTVLKSEPLIFTWYSDDPDDN